MNYVGNKYKFIPKFKQLFPKEINTMVDLFCGGCDVTFNTSANKHIANDINHITLSIYQFIQRIGVNDFIDYLEDTIEHYQLSKTNEQGFKELREDYNLAPNPTYLYALICYSFNYQPRFNAAHQYNSSFGRNRSQFTANMKKGLQSLKGIIEHIEFTTYDFADFPFERYVSRKDDFIYADPPYLISNAFYNDGKRGFKGWNEDLERQLLDTLLTQHNRGIKFALSNVLVHREQTNTLLQNWVNENNFHIYDMNIRYDNASYNTIHKGCETREVLITNYD